MPDATEVIQAEPEEDFTLFQEVLHGDHLYGTEEQYPDRGGGTSGEARIQRASDENYWTGSAWQAAEIWLNTAVHSTGLKHSITLPGVQVVEGEEFFVTIGLPNEVLSRTLVYVVAGAISGGGGGGTSSSLSVPDDMVVPDDATDNDYSAEMTLINDDGELQDSDNTPTLVARDETGSAPTGLTIGSPVNTATGKYRFPIAIDQSAAPPKVVHFEGGYEHDAESKILTAAGTLQKTLSAKADTDAIDAAITAIQGAGFDGATDSLAAIRGLLDSIKTCIGTDADAAADPTLFGHLKDILVTYLQDSDFGLATLDAHLEDIIGRLGPLAAGAPDCDDVTAGNVREKLDFIMSAVCTISSETVDEAPGARFD